MGREKIENPFPSDFEGNSSGIEPSAALRNAIHFPTRSRKRSENDGISSPSSPPKSAPARGFKKITYVKGFLASASHVCPRGRLLAGHYERPLRVTPTQNFYLDDVDEQPSSLATPIHADYKVTSKRMNPPHKLRAEPEPAIRRRLYSVKIGLSSPREHP